VANLNKEKAALDNGEWDKFCEIVTNHMHAEHLVRLKSRAATPVDPSSDEEKNKDTRVKPKGNKGNWRGKRKAEYTPVNSRDPSPANSRTSSVSTSNSVLMLKNEQSPVRCDGCNRPHKGGRGNCRFKEHIDFNKTGPFKGSNTEKRIELYNKNNPSSTPMVSLIFGKRYTSRGTLEDHHMPNTANPKKTSKIFKYH
jgi:hypothetical protein